MDTERLRTFIALELDQPFRETIRKIQNDLKKADADVRWTRPENCHLTLKFLGDVAVKQIDPLLQKIRNIAASSDKFSMQLTELGTFPKAGYPRIIWVACLPSTSALQEIVARLEADLNELGFKKENKEFKPHITLGRGRSARNKSALVSRIKKTTVDKNIHQTVGHITLFKSTLTPQGPIYEPLEKIDLAQK